MTSGRRRKRKGRIKESKGAEHGEHIRADARHRTPYKTHYPAFSLRYLSGADFSLNSCDQEQKAALAETLRKLSQLRWQDIQASNRHKNGFEKIPQSAIRASIPKHVTEDVTLLAFRFWNFAPMVGYRDEEIFFILWLDPMFKLYDHGS